MLMNILLGATMYPSLIIVFFVVKTQSFKNRNMIFGVRLPAEMQDAEPVRQITASYNKQMKMILIALLISPVLCFFTHYTSIQFTLWMLWFLGGIFIMNLPYTLANKAATTLRQELSSEEDSDDRYWIFGMFYNNPGDKRTFVEKRFGIGMTTNMATRTGKVTIWVAILALIWIPFMCFWMILEDFTPMHISISENAVVCSHLKEDYVIPVDSIQEITLLNVPPLNRHKISGTGTDTMEKGKYNASMVGGYYSFINPEQEAFILIKAEDKVYLISGSTDAETLEVYEQIK